MNKKRTHAKALLRSAWCVPWCLGSLLWGACAADEPSLDEELEKQISAVRKDDDTSKAGDTLDGTRHHRLEKEGRKTRKAGNAHKSSKASKVKPPQSNQECSPAGCDDGNPCTSDHCEQGTCTHGPTKGKDTACDDGLFCTVDDRCHDGSCVGRPRDCSDVADFCHTAYCNEDEQGCISERRLADCDDQCSASRERRAYRKGWQKAVERVSRQWGKKMDDCDQVEDFADRIIEKMGDLDSDLASEQSRRDKACRIAGLLDGGYDVLETIQANCSETCLLRGELVGAVSARHYCELAIETDGAVDAEQWIRQPVNLCGLDFETACDGTFIGESSVYDNADGACLPYTEDEFFAAWDNTRLRSCDYHENSNR